MSTETRYLFECPHCQVDYKATKSPVDKTIVCRQCKKEFTRSQDQIKVQERTIVGDESKTSSNRTLDSFIKFGPWVIMLVVVTFLVARGTAPKPTPDPTPSPTPTPNPDPDIWKDALEAVNGDKDIAKFFAVLSEETADLLEKDAAKNNRAFKTRSDSINYLAFLGENATEGRTKGKLPKLPDFIAEQFAEGKYPQDEGPMTDEDYKLYISRWREISKAFNRASQ